MKYINNMKQFLNENENVNGKITFSIKIISKRTFLSDGYHGYNEAMLKFKNYDSDIDKLLDNINIFDQMSIILNSDEISGNFGKYKFEFEDEQQIDDIINLLIKNGFYFKKNKKINNSINYIDLKKMSNI